MNMQEHILAALREQFDRWEQTLAGVSEEQIATPLSPSDWSIKDNVVHLWAWQLRSIARLEAALYERPPVMPAFMDGVELVTEDNVDELNARIYAAFGEQPWAKVYQDWRSGFLKFLDTAAQIPEKDLLDWDKYSWLGGFNLAAILIGSYEHHQEHLEKLLARR